MNGHLSDRELMLFLDGESAEPGGHLEGCDRCRTRLRELERAAREFEVEYRKLRVPPAVEATALPFERANPRIYLLPAASAIAALLVIGVAVRTFKPTAAEPEFAPAASLTPGATRPVSLASICTAEDRPALRRVSKAVAEQVFRNYGIRSPAPRSYEIDYLIPPDLGGSEDPLNLWPQPYSHGVWNARVKDALEDRLRSLVCEGKLDLATAQHELARDWIGAYKRYFRTDRPLLDHVAFYKDRPWE